MLNDHPAVVCNSDPFNPDDPDNSWPSEPPRTTEEMIRAAFVDYPLRGHEKASVRSVGCKLEDGRIVCEPGRLARLMQVPNIRFIILQRQNQFECLRSHLQATITGNWHLPVGQTTSTPPVAISPLRAQKFFERAVIFYGRLSLIIPPGMRVWLDYEQLKGQTDMVMDHLWKFLEVPPWTPTPQLQKIEDRPLSETVANYAELQLVFRETDYGIFLP
jgi:hypothetical protein